MKNASMLKDRKDLITFFKNKNKDFIDLGNGGDVLEMNNNIKKGLYKQKETMAHILSGINAKYFYY